MRVPLSWLGDYVPLGVSVEELADRLGTATAGVEAIQRRGVADVNGNLGLYRVGRVVEAGKHPNADRLQLCRVDVGESEPRQIVCGAWNFGEGATVAVALPGAVLPDGRTLERAKLRGSVSDGMILSERELELGQDHTGILVLSEPAEPGTPLADVLPLADTVLDLETTPNRPDLLSIYGIAREVAALFGVELSPPPGRDPDQIPVEEDVDVTIEDYEGCPRYIGRLFRDVQLGPSPVWLKARLVSAGMRPISNVVDVTNYVMHALGNPLHVFDFDTLAGGRIVVRRARPDEEFTTLDGTARKLDPADLVIADGERAVAFAGIMGGLDTEVTEKTTTVLLEAANFEPVGILWTSERHALRTEGSNRWEKGVDPHLAPQAAAFATELILELAQARWTGHVDVKGDLPERPVVRFRPERANELIGLEILAPEQERILGKLGFEVGGDEVTVPTWRARDVTREADVVEEVARFHLDEVPFTLARGVDGLLTREQKLRRVVEDVLVGAGCSEAYTFSLTAEDPAPDAIRLPVPLTSDQAVLRTTLLHGLVESARRNVDAGNEDVALFEISRIYLPAGGPKPDEHWHAGCIVEGGFERAMGVLETLYDALHVSLEVEPAEWAFLHPGKSARFNGGWLGELHPTLLEGEWGVFEVDLGMLFEQVPERIVYEDVITFPALRQDLAFVVDETVAAGELVAAAREAAGPELRELRPFDVYRGEGIGEGRKSIAFHAVFQSPERTLSDEDGRELRERIVAALGERFGAELRA